MNKTIGIFGGGQLGRMMAQAALPLNIQCSFFEAEKDCPAAILGPVFSSKDQQGLQDFIASADVFSLEFENTPVADVDVLTQTRHCTLLALPWRRHKIAWQKKVCLTNLVFQLRRIVLWIAWTA